jgi:hypothetical protein
MMAYVEFRSLQSPIERRAARPQRDGGDPNRAGKPGGGGLVGRSDRRGGFVGPRNPAGRLADKQGGVVSHRHSGGTMKPTDKARWPSPGYVRC